MPDRPQPALRLFVGLELPDAIRRALSRLDHGTRGVRWVRDDMLHVTLAFLGEVDATRAGRLREALGDVCATAFDVRLAGVGTFGGTRPRVVWAGLADTPTPLASLREQVVAAAMRAGITPDQSPFHPHVTLGRMRNVTRAVVQPFLDRYAHAEFGAWTVNAVVLFRSVLSAKGPSYPIDMRCALATGPRGRAID